jgi:RHS repeat-associated protein
MEDRGKGKAENRAKPTDNACVTDASGNIVMTAAPTASPVRAPQPDKQPSYLVPKYNNVEYTYDAVGNRLSMTTEAGTTNYRYNDADQLTQAGDTKYSYDANGNRITEDGAKGKVNYFYTSANRLSQVSFAEGSFASYGYDALGRKVARTELTYKAWTENGQTEEGQESETEESAPSDKGGSGKSECAPGKSNGNVKSQGGNALLNGNGNKYGLLKKLGHPLMPDMKADVEQTSYLYMGLSNTIHKEYSDKGSPYAEYVMGPNQSIVSRKMFGLHGLSNPAKEPSLDTNGGMLYYAYNGRHTVSELTDRHGDVIESYRYDAFGGITSGITAPYNTASYTGQHYDDVAGLMDMKARWYDPTAGRFLQQDTWAGSMTTPWTQNRYAYVGNNPINLWDPTGNVPEWVRSQSSHVEAYGDHVDSFWWKKWTFQSYSSSYGAVSLVSTTRDLRNIYEDYTQDKYETWNYGFEYVRSIFGPHPTTGETIQVGEEKGSSTETYSETTVYTWTNTITAGQVAAQNQEVLQGYGPPPENAIVTAKKSAVNGVLISAEINAVSFMSLTSVQQLMVANRVYSFIGEASAGSQSPQEQSSILEYTDSFGMGGGTPDDEEQLKKLFDARDSGKTTEREEDSYEGDGKYPSAIQSEIRHLSDLWFLAEGDTDMQNQIHAAANALRTIGDAGSNYAVLRLNTFIPLDSVSVPLVGSFSGDGEQRGYDVNSLSVRTQQYVVINTDTGLTTAANYVGATHKLEDGNEVGSLRASNANMSVTSLQQEGTTFIHATINVSNPMVKIAPPIDYDVFVNTSDGRIAGVANNFPAYEVYMSSNGGEYEALYQYMPSNPTNMFAACLMCLTMKLSKKLGGPDEKFYSRNSYVCCDYDIFNYYYRSNCSRIW